MSHATFNDKTETIPANNVFDQEAGDSSFQQHIASQLQTPSAGNSSPRKLSTSVAKGEALLNDENVHTKLLSTIRTKKGYIIDMDGVIYHGSKLLPGAKEFVNFLIKNNKKFLFLTNNSAPTPRELQQKLGRLGIDVEEDKFYTAALATAQFLKSQMPEGGTVYVIGEPGLTFALYEQGFYMNDVNPDYVVLGEGPSYNYEKLCKAVNLVNKGAKLIATNLDVETLNSSGEHIPSCGAFAACVELVTKTKAFFCGKPSALIMRYAQHALGLNRQETCIIGDRMDTDVVAGVNSQIDPVLVLSGVTKIEDLRSFPYRPFVVLKGVFEIPSDDDANKVTNAELEEAGRRLSMI
ncbi:hypothetical protein NQZ79_g4453 [Umbelopsis isabellina]|nr:hypothetical protein NQZ79_g4453 [Umbelopsis isabellina]